MRAAGMTCTFGSALSSIEFQCLHLKIIRKVAAPSPVVFFPFNRPESASQVPVRRLDHVRLVNEARLQEARVGLGPRVVGAVLVEGAPDVALRVDGIKRFTIAYISILLLSKQSQFNKHAGIVIIEHYYYTKTLCL
jgi:hypothetical protein